MSWCLQYPHCRFFFKGKIYVFRGGNGRNYLNDLHSLDVDTYKWHKIAAKEEYPPERANHGSSIIESYLYIFGGWNGHKRLDDLHKIDLSILFKRATF